MKHLEMDVNIERFRRVEMDKRPGLGGPGFNKDPLISRNRRILAFSSCSEVTWPGKGSQTSSGSSGSGFCFFCGATSSFGYGSREYG